jgi:hypothetical protein
MAKLRYGTFAEVASDLGISIEKLVNDVVDRKRRVIGYNCESEEIEAIPSEYFTIDRRLKVPPREDPSITTMDDGTRDFLSKLYPLIDWNDPEIVRKFHGGFEWIDADHDERTGEALMRLAKADVCPPTSLDPDEGTVFINGRHRWINIKVERLEIDPPPRREGASSEPPNVMKRHSPRSRGPSDPKWRRVMNQMQQEIDNGCMSRAALDAMVEKDLESKYGVSRYTARKARNEVLGRR